MNFVETNTFSCASRVKHWNSQPILVGIEMSSVNIFDHNHCTSKINHGPGIKSHLFFFFSSFCNCNIIESGSNEITGLESIQNRERITAVNLNQLREEVGKLVCPLWLVGEETSVL